MNAQVKKLEDYWTEIVLEKWAEWKNTDDLIHLGYPVECATHRKVFDAKKDNAWRKNYKTSRSHNTALPDWKIEIATEESINSMAIELQRVLYANYSVRVDHEKLLRFRISARNMHLYGRDGKYSWPRFKKNRIDALRMPQMTYYRSLNLARSLISEDKKIVENA